MRRAPLHLALLISLVGWAGCASSTLPDPADPDLRRVEITATHEVRLPADPYTPTAQALPILHEIGGRLCGRDYRIVDRHMGRDFEARASYNPTFRMTLPAYQHSWAIIARIQCLRIH